MLHAPESGAGQLESKTTEEVDERSIPLPWGLIYIVGPMLQVKSINMAAKDTRDRRARTLRLRLWMPIAYCKKRLRMFSIAGEVAGEFVKSLRIEPNARRENIQSMSRRDMTTAGRIASALISSCILSLMLPFFLPLRPTHLGSWLDWRRTRSACPHSACSLPPVAHYLRCALYINICCKNVSAGALPQTWM